MIKVKAISSLEKVLPTDTFDKFSPVSTLTALKGERVSFQIILEDPIAPDRAAGVRISVRSKLSKHLSRFLVELVPVDTPAYLERCAGEYLTKTPGLLPDVLTPLKKDELRLTPRYNLQSYWFTAQLPEDLAPGKYPIYITFRNEENVPVAKATVTIDVKDAVLPKSDLKFTQWFHCDCIADYFGVKMMSQKHWQLIDRFMKVAVHTGINMILTPLFTPPLDTAIGAERPTMQLVRVEKQGDQYSFNFDLLDRWVAMAEKNGIKYFELSHLFTQWGACACPKIVVWEDGEEKKLFGWHVPSGSELYKNFLSQFLPALTAHLEALGIRERCYFHISDEPSRLPERPDYDNYLAAKTFIRPFIGDNLIMDALSSVDFYDNGLIECPVPATNHIEPFLERTPKERWCYYCCSQCQEVANRFIAQPSYRTRVSGLQFYMNGIEGFLHWGFNFYNTRRSVAHIDPYRTTDAQYAFPSGDPFSVYPYEDGAIESLRAVVFYEGLQDRMLLKQLEAKIGAEQVRQMVQSIAGNAVPFDNCQSAEIITKIHDTAIALLTQ